MRPLSTSIFFEQKRMENLMKWRALLAIFNLAIVLHKHSRSWQQIVLPKAKHMPERHLYHPLPWRSVNWSQLPQVSGLISDLMKYIDRSIPQRKRYPASSPLHRKKNQKESPGGSSMKACSLPGINLKILIRQMGPLRKGRKLQPLTSWACDQYSESILAANAITHLV